MTKQTIGIGSTADDGTGDPLRTAFTKTNANFGEVYGVSGILKSNGTDTLASAISGTDYAPATSGSAILKGNGAGGFASAASGTDYAPATSGTSILYGNGSGGFSAVTIGSGLSFSTGTLSATGGGSLPSPGASGNLLTSDGTNWTSAAPATQDLSALSATWNNAGTTFYGIKYEVTPTAYATGSRILSLWYSGLETFYVNPSGGVAYTKNYIVCGTGSVLSNNGELKARNNGGGTTGSIGFSSSASVDQSSGAWETAWRQGGTGFMNLRGGTSLTAGAAVGFLEMTAPATPVANGAQLYIEDNGSGKTRLVVKWDDGTTAVLATQA